VNLPFGGYRYAHPLYILVPIVFVLFITFFTIMVSVVPVMIVIIPVMVPMIFVTAIPIPSVILTIIGNVFISIPTLLHKIHGSATGIIPATVAAPTFCMSGWHSQIDRLVLFHNMPMDNNRLAINDTGWWVRKFTDIDAAIKPGLANTYGNANV
jgi:hypothetical protein